MHTYTHNDKEPIYHSCCSGLLSRCSLKETPGLEKLMTQLYIQPSSVFLEKTCILFDRSPQLL